MGEEEKTITPEIVKREEQPQEKSVAFRSQDDAIIPDAKNLYYLARGFARSRMFPGIKDEYEALAVLELGRELGIKPAISLQTIVPVKGRLCVESKVYQAILERNGIKITVLEKTPERCRIKFEKPGKDPYIEEYKIEDAKRAGLAGKDNWLKNPGPAMMNYYRCISNGGRVYDPGSVLGLYTSEEMKDAGPFRVAKKRDDADEAKKKKQEEEKKKAEEEAKAEKKEEKPEPQPEEEKPESKPEEEKPKRKRGRPRKKPEPEAKPEEEKPAPAAEPKPETKPEPKQDEQPDTVEPGEGDASQMTEEEKVEYFVGKIKEDFRIRFTSEKKYMEQYRLFKDFLYQFQTDKNSREGKDYLWVDYNDFNHLSLSMGRGEDLKNLWKNWRWILSAWIAYEKKKEEREKEEEDEPPIEWPQDEGEPEEF
jgi:hypothetical protein